MSDKKIELPSVLSFERKLEPSDALMYSANWADIPSDFQVEDLTLKPKKKSSDEDKPIWQQIPIKPRYNRSTQSAFGIDDIKKTEANPVASGNDDATLFAANDTLKVSFSIRVIGNVGDPFACNSSTFSDSIKSKVKEFKDGSGLEVLAKRYAYNIANGRFLWRNRVCAEKLKIHVFLNNEKEPLIFNAYEFSLKDFEENNNNESLGKLSAHIQKGLISKNDFTSSEDSFTSITINAYIKLGKGQHVYPSEEMKLKEKGKTLFCIEDCAAMHNVKIGNAIRTIDDWYDKNILIKKGKKAEATTVNTKDIRPIAIEPYGSVTQQGVAFRPSKNDLYTLMKKWFEQESENVTDNEKYYIVANLIRGGLFQLVKNK